MIKILIADDHAVVREGFRKMVENDPELKIVAEAENGIEALQMVRSKNIDVVILDMSMPEMSGLDCLKQIKSEFPDLPVLIFSMHPEEQYEQRVLQAGASGYLTKKTTPMEVLQAIKDIASGKKLMSEALKERVIKGKGKLEEPHLKLSDREFQVMKLIAKGWRSKEIANYLKISEKTVTTYRGRVLKKLGLDSNSDLVRYCIEHNIEIDA
ncbi:MAG: response regulator transcription factor [Ignavibacteria bacterium]|jgi:DNA-binding NarL/FixJ family response regulator|nr:response regulator transcription factor [Ignavibacteria bacterium]MDH7527785.1 response regulator transcription factor [Ignavibacteria bacterium]NPV11021.1 response regulator transcription factor [Ignavibacteria bacterium]